MYYDSNNVQLSTKVDEVDQEDIAAKYRAWGWQVLEIDGHNVAQIREALTTANASTDKPTLIVGHTIMGKGLVTADGESFEDKVSTHGQPISAAGAGFDASISNLGGDPKNPFQIFPEVAELYAARANALREEMGLARLLRQSGVRQIRRWHTNSTPSFRVSSQRLTTAQSLSSRVQQLVLLRLPYWVHTQSRLRI
jgi:transketolase